MHGVDPLFFITPSPRPDRAPETGSQQTLPSSGESTANPVGLAQVPEMHIKPPNKAGRVTGL